MTIEEAVKYCEDHECEECYVYKDNLDKRSVEEILRGTPCCINLVKYSINPRNF